MRRHLRDDRGAGLVEYALVILVIALASITVVGNVGDSTTDSFDVAAGAFAGSTADTTADGPEMTPEEEWAKAQDDYDKAIADAAATRTAEIDEARANYDAARDENASLPKAERQQKNAAAKDQFDSARSAANAKHSEAVKAAKDAKTAAKTKYQESN